jgi:hypothetical protein
VGNNKRGTGSSRTRCREEKRSVEVSACRVLSSPPDVKSPIGTNRRIDVKRTCTETSNPTREHLTKSPSMESHATHHSASRPESPRLDRVVSRAAERRAERTLGSRPRCEEKERSTVLSGSKLHATLRIKPGRSGINSSRLRRTFFIVSWSCENAVRYRASHEHTTRRFRAYRTKEERPATRPAVTRDPAAAAAPRRSAPEVPP